MKIQGAILESIGVQRPYRETRPLVVQELDLDEPAAGEVLLRIESAGVCHSDLSVVDGNRPRPLPMLLGHEAAGIVERLGSGVSDIAVGQRVVTVFLPRCEDCAACATGGRLPCTVGSAANAAGVLPGDGSRLHRDGEVIRHHLGVSGFATHAVVNRRSVVPVGADVPPAVAALLGCAVLTGGGAVINAARPEAGESIIVVGLGGVGMAALLTAIAVSRSSTKAGAVIGVDANPEKLARARELGADAVYTPEELSRAGVVAPVVIEAAGHPRAFETAVEATAPGGRTVTVGLPAPDARSSISPLGITAEARTIIGSYLGSAVPSRDVPVFEQLWRDGLLPVEELVSSRVQLDAINEAMDALAEGRAVRSIIEFPAGQVNR